MTSADPFGQRDVRRAYDTVAEDYAALLPDTRAEAPLDLTMVDAFAAAVSADDDPSVRGHREGRAGVPPRPPSIGP